MKINTTNSDVKGTKRVNDFYGDTESPSAPVRNDLSSDTTLGGKVSINSIKNDLGGGAGFTTNGQLFSKRSKVGKSDVTDIVR